MFVFFFLFFFAACQKIIQQRLACSITCMTPSDSRPTTPGTPNTSNLMSLSHFNSLKHVGSTPSPSPCSNLIIPSGAASGYGVYTSPNSPNHVPHSLPYKVSGCAISISSVFVAAAADLMLFSKRMDNRN